MKKALNKTKLAKRLGISRPTLYKRLQKGTVSEETDLAMEKLAVKLMSRQNHISPTDIDEVLEFLADYGHLTDEGRKFASSFWKLFIKD